MIPYLVVRELPSAVMGSAVILPSAMSRAASDEVSLAATWTSRPTFWLTACTPSPTIRIWGRPRPRLAARACSMSDLNTAVTAVSNSRVKSIWRMSCKLRVRPGSRGVAGLGGGLGLLAGGGDGLGGGGSGGSGGKGGDGGDRGEGGEGTAAKEEYYVSKMCLPISVCGRMEIQWCTRSTASSCCW